MDLDYETIFLLSKKLGSDVPFFIEGGCQFCFGRGEILEKYSSNFDFGVILLKNPNISISTVDTYKKYSHEFCPKNFTETEKTNKIRNDLRINGFNDFKLSEQRINVKNDLQVIVERENNSVKKALYLLSNLQNCLSFSMSGSGPTCFALFKDINIASEVFEQNHKIFNNYGYEAWVCKLIDSGITFL